MDISHATLPAEADQNNVIGNNDQIVTKSFIQKHPNAFRARIPILSDFIDEKCAQGDELVKNSPWLARSLWSIVKRVVGNKLIWGMGILTLCLIVPHIMIPLILAIGIFVAIWGVYQNTTSAYYWAKYDKELSSKRALSYAIFVCCSNLVIVVLTALTFGGAGIFGHAANVFLDKITLAILKKTGAKEWIETNILTPKTLLVTIVTKVNGDDKKSDKIDNAQLKEAITTWVESTNKNEQTTQKQIIATTDNIIALNATNIVMKENTDSQKEVRIAIDQLASLLKKEEPKEESFKKEHISPRRFGVSYEPNEAERILKDLHQELILLDEFYQIEDPDEECKSLSVLSEAPVDLFIKESPEITKNDYLIAATIPEMPNNILEDAGRNYEQNVKATISALEATNAKLKYDFPQIFYEFNVNINQAKLKVEELDNKSKYSDFNSMQKEWKKLKHFLKSGEHALRKNNLLDSSIECLMTLENKYIRCAYLLFLAIPEEKRNMLRIHKECLPFCEAASIQKWKTGGSIEWKSWKKKNKIDFTSAKFAIIAAK